MGVCTSGPLRYGKDSCDPGALNENNNTNSQGSTHHAKAKSNSNANSPQAPATVKRSGSVDAPFDNYDPSAWKYSATSISDISSSHKTTDDSGGGAVVLNKAQLSPSPYDSQASPSTAAKAAWDRGSRRSSQYIMDDIAVNAGRKQSGIVLEGGASMARRESHSLRQRQVSLMLSETRSLLESISEKRKDENIDTFLERLFNVIDTTKRHKISKAEMTDYIQNKVLNRKSSTSLVPDNGSMSPTSAFNRGQKVNSFSPTHTRGVSFSDSSSSNNNSLAASGWRNTIDIMFRVADDGTDHLMDLEAFQKFFHFMTQENVSILAESDLDVEVPPAHHYTTPLDLVDISVEGLSKPTPSSSMLASSTYSICANNSNNGYSSSGNRRKAQHAHYPLMLRDVRVWPLQSQAERIKCIALSPDGALYAVTHRSDPIVHVCQPRGEERVGLVGHGDSLLGISFSADKKFVATASRDGLMVLWDRTVGLEYHYVEHPGIVTAVQMSYDGKVIYTGCQDDLVRKLKVPKGKLLATSEAMPTSETSVVVTIGVQHTKDTHIVLSHSCDKGAYIADAKDLSILNVLGGHDTLVWSACFSATDVHVLTCCEKRIIVWDTRGYVRIAQYDCTEVKPPMSPNVCWTAAIFGPSAYQNLIFAFNTERQMLVFELPTSRKRDRHQRNQANIDSSSSSSHEVQKENLATTDPAQSLMDLYFHSSVYAVAFPCEQNFFICGDDDGNVYRVELS